MKIAVIAFGLVISLGFAFARAESADSTSPQLIRSEQSDGADIPSGRLLLRVPSHEGANGSASDQDNSEPPAEPGEPGAENDTGTFFGEAVGSRAVFIIDVSNSMEKGKDVGAGEDYDGNVVTSMTRIDAVKYELVRMLGNLPAGDCAFDIVWLAGIEVGGPTPGMPVTDAWQGEMTTGTPEKLQEAIDAVKNQRVWFGTPTYRALERATHDYGAEIDTLVLLSDGAPIPVGAGYWGSNTHQQAILDQFPKWFEPMEANGCRFSVIQVGVNSICGAFMQNLAAATGASFTHKH
ncbi:MAG: hypothetical protein L6Q71_02455 [Planctomycetes bacterium]|nr:hypothetical protein [Planctomycetota bacterium]NUQ36072.1 hypothetical protein [Planctomycetaceae bacterium]